MPTNPIPATPTAFLLSDAFKQQLPGYTLFPTLVSGEGGQIVEGYDAQGRYINVPVDASGHVTGEPTVGNGRWDPAKPGGGGFDWLDTWDPYAGTGMTQSKTPGLSTRAPVAAAAAPPVVQPRGTPGVGDQSQPVQSPVGRNPITGGGGSVVDPRYASKYSAAVADPTGQTFGAVTAGADGTLAAKVKDLLAQQPMSRVDQAGDSPAAYGRGLPAVGTEIQTERDTGRPSIPDQYVPPPRTPAPGAVTPPITPGTRPKNPGPLLPPDTPVTDKPLTIEELLAGLNSDDPNAQAKAYGQMAKGVMDNPGALTIATLLGSKKPKSWLANPSIGYGTENGRANYYNDAGKPFLEGSDTKSNWFNRADQKWYAGDIDKNIQQVDNPPWMTVPWTKGTENSWQAPQANGSQYLNAEGRAFGPGDPNSYWYNKSDQQWYEGDLKKNVKPIYELPWMKK